MNVRFFDKFFSQIRSEEIVAIYTALLSEEKTILVVCDNPNDLVPMVTTLLELMFPFEWSLPRIPFLVVPNLEDKENQMFEMINNI